MSVTVPKADWPDEKDWPKPGWKHALNHQRFSPGSVFGWLEDGRLWTGIVEETGPCCVRVNHILPGVRS